MILQNKLKRDGKEINNLGTLGEEKVKVDKIPEGEFQETKILNGQFGFG